MFSSANLALHGLATQRQTDESDPVFKPESAVDGNASTCTKTLHDEPRWSVNLGTRRYVVGLNIIVPQRGLYGVLLMSRRTASQCVRLYPIQLST